MGDYTLKELAEAVGKKERTLRFYQEEGLLRQPGKIGPGSHYDEDDLARLRLIGQLQKAGRSLDEIKASFATLGDAGIRTEALRHGSALDYIRSVLGDPARPVVSHLAESVIVPPASPAQTAQWERIEVAPGIELHVKQPISAAQRRAIAAYVARARSESKGRVDGTETRDRSKFIRANGNSNRFVLARFTAPPSEQRRARPPVNVAFVIDRSGSMSGQKIELAKQAVQTAVSLLKPSDRFAIVTYDDQIDVVAPSTGATAEAKRNATQALRGVDARGSTNLGEGWLRGCEQVAAIQDERYITRVILLTDGRPTKASPITTSSAGRRALRERGVMTTTSGSARTSTKAAAGDGARRRRHFYFVERASQILDTMTSGAPGNARRRGSRRHDHGVGTKLLTVEPLTDAIVERVDDSWRPSLATRSLNRLRSGLRITSLRTRLVATSSAR